MDRHKIIGINSWRFSKDSPFKCFACGKDIPDGGSICLECDSDDPKFLLKPCPIESTGPKPYAIGGKGVLYDSRYLQRNSFT